jgi:hypothetical protein
VPYSVSATCTQCTPTAEVCDGCDNDCDGDIDEGAPAAPCGFPNPPSCLGTRPCVAKTAPGGYLQSIGRKVGECVPPPVYGTCSAVGTGETCNGIDDNCDGLIDNNPSGTGGACTPTPTSPTIGECKAGTRICVGGSLVCTGYVGPTTEICDGKDNDCDGLVDSADPDIVGTGGVCGSDVNQCSKGTFACIGGVLTCTGGQQPVPEICNGLDDDCNNLTDDGVTDTPPDLGCWRTQSANCTLTCGYDGKVWCPPTGGTCTGLGTLSGACAVGGLVCQGPNGWVCQGDQGPMSEQCNGLDDDCNGQTDDGLGPPIGDACGENIPNSPCTQGVTVCVNGRRECSGGQPQAEICNGRDDDCDRVVDNGQGVGGPCPLPDDPRFPGDRTHGTCRPGALQCDGAGNQICVGGQGPVAEICDGLDNDCDGTTDEVGDPPDGINGTADPNNPAQIIGAVCGADAGVCEPGRYGCQQARVVCVGGVTAVNAETCDCEDNNCNGEIDEDLPGRPVCTTSNTVCVAVSPGFCRCLEPCKPGEFPCPGGQICNYTLPRSGTMSVQANGVCVPTANACGDCSKKTVTRPDGTVECAPAGSQPNSSRPIPVCVCKNPDGCHEPCFKGPVCSGGQECSPIDAKCRDPSNCFFFGCPTGQTCSGSGVCGPNPCEPNPCTGATPVCRPSSDLTTHACVGSCAGVTCSTPGDVCVDGECAPSGCNPSCPAGQFCDRGAGTCVPDQCVSPRCDDGKYCEPSTGRCIDDPCGGVACPAGQTCLHGQCNTTQVPSDGGASGAGGSSGDAGPLGTGGTGTAGSGQPKPKSAFGLATGGGGCACSVPRQDSNRAGLLAGLGMALVLGARRRARREAETTKGGS